MIPIVLRPRAIEDLRAAKRHNEEALEERRRNTEDGIEIWPFALFANALAAGELP